MAINFDRLMSLKIPDATQTYTRHDSILYALGLGCGLGPSADDELTFVYEENQQAIPTMAGVLAHPGFWIRDLDTGIDWVRVVHGEQTLEMHTPLPVEGTVVGKNKVVDVIDKGEGGGALVASERKLFDAATNELIATVGQVTFCRGQGGFGGPERPKTQPHAIPDRAADVSVALETSQQSALIYRLSGDFNPLHADPKVAKAAGFDRPIYHGLGTYGVAARAILQGACGFDAAKIRVMNARFTAPVFPGETFLTEIWRDKNEISYRVRCVERDLIAINNGKVLLSD